MLHMDGLYLKGRAEYDKAHLSSVSWHVCVQSMLSNVFDASYGSFHMLFPVSGPKVGQIADKTSCLPNETEVTPNADYGPFPLRKIKSVAMHPLLMFNYSRW